MAGILCVGSIIVDLAKIIDRYPERERLALIESVSPSTGGPGLNMAVDLRMLGATWPVAMAGAIGDDTNGQYVLDECARLGVDTAAVRVVPGAVTSFTDAMIEADGGRRTFFHHAGANDLIDETFVDLTTAGIRTLHLGAPGIHAGLDTALPGGGNGWSMLLQRAQAASWRTNLELVSLAPKRIAELALPCLPHLDSIVVNEIEASAVTGRDVVALSADGPVDWDGLSDVALSLISLGVAGVAVIHFPAGCVAATADGQVYRQGSVLVPESQVRNRTGAGDAFAAGVLYGLHESWSVPECLRLGVASAALSIRSPHTSDGIAAAAMCLAAAERDGFRPVG